MVWEKVLRDQDFIRLDREVLSACSSDSIDYAVMEHTDQGFVVPLDAGWSDIGNRDAGGVLPSAPTGNRIQGKVLP